MPAAAQDRPAAPDIANLIAQQQTNVPTEMASLSPAVPANPYDDRVPLRSPSYVHPAEELNITDSITKLLALPEQLSVAKVAATQVCLPSI